MSVESKLADHIMRPRAFVTNAELQFIKDMREAARRGVGYGWMQQIIEWEWQDKGLAARGPEYFGARIRELEAKITPE